MAELAGKAQYDQGVLGGCAKNVMFDRRQRDAVIAVAAARNETFSEVVRWALDMALPLVCDWRPTRLPSATGLGSTAPRREADPASSSSRTPVVSWEAADGRPR